MKASELLDALSKGLAVLALALYYSGYIDMSQLHSILSAIIAIMVSLLLHKHRKGIARFFKRVFRPSIIWVKGIKSELIIDRRCKICRHLKRAEIEKMLLDGKSYQEIANAFNNEFSVSCLSRHLRMHMPRLILEPEKINQLYEEHRIKQIDLADELFKLLGRLNDLYNKLEKLDEKFFADKPKVSPHAYVKSISERRNILAQIRETLITIEELKTEIKTEKDLSELLQKLASRPSESS
jgi:hypothetical protein